MDIATCMTFSSLLYPATVRAQISLDSQKAFFAYVGTIAARALGLDAAEVAAALAEREQIGTTAFGRGIALPHAKIGTLHAVRGLFFHLQKPIDFQALDGLSVDIIFTLLSPPQAGAEHLKTLAYVSRALRDERFVACLRGAKNDAALYALAVDSTVGALSWGALS